MKFLAKTIITPRYFNAWAYIKWAWPNTEYQNKIQYDMMK
jgi:hypothetical protein